MNYTSDQMKAARKADLYDYLIKNHSNLIKLEGTSIHPANNRSISIRRGYCGYTDFATGETGNSVDFLVKYLGYTITDAVLALCSNTSYVPEDTQTASLISGVITSGPSAVTTVREIILPPHKDGAFRQLFAYLMNRSIPSGIIKSLINEGLLYQENTHNNMVFLNRDVDYAEIHGTLSYGRSFHSCRKTCKDRFWSFFTTEGAHTAYICEAAIDAISLYQLKHLKGDDTPACYISIGGVANQATIDRIKSMDTFTKVILAVDNDEAGERCRSGNADIPYILPKHKDWNEDLMAL